jgi:hypothetical protein
VGRARRALGRDPAVHRGRLFRPGGAPSWFAVEQSLDDYAEWSGSSGAVERLTLDSVEPLDDLVERALEFLGRPTSS